MNHCRLFPAARRSALATTALLLLAASAPFASARLIEAVDPLPGPPHYTLEDHVFNGCHLSTIAFLARFHAAHPEERGETIILTMKNEDGAFRSHTVALVSWHGAWWCRDEYFGVIALGRRVEARRESARLTERLQAVLEQRGREVMQGAASGQPPRVPSELSQAQELHEVVTATRIIPFPTRIYWIGTGAKAVPVAFFRPSASQIAVYEPLHGTCVADCSLADDARVVALVAARLGFDARRVHPAPDLAKGALVALAGTSSPSLSR
jgi:hypothetical protein